MTQLRLDLADWLDSKAEILESCFLFSDQSDFAREAAECFKDGTKFLSRLAKQSKALETKVAAGPLNLLAQLDLLQQAISKLNAKKIGAKDHQNARQQLKNVITNMPMCASSQPPPTTSQLEVADLKDQLPIHRAFHELFADHHRQPAYWAVLAMCERALAKKILPRPSGKNATSKWATTATLFYKEANAQAGDDGYVLWFSVDLFDDYPGLLVPDLLAFGLTDFSELLDPIQTCWRASGLAERYRGVWRLTSHYPGDHPEFKRLNNNIRQVHLPSLEGGSLSAAVLAGLWAAAGSIPQADGSSFDIGGASLRLNPKIAVSATLKTSTVNTKNSSIELHFITNPSVTGKVRALSRYANSEGDHHQPFDTAIVCAEEAKVDELRREFTKAGEQRSDFLGVRIVEDLKKMEQVLELILEVNQWKQKWFQSSSSAWDEMWCFVHNQHGQFLDGDGQVICDNSGNPIVRPDCGQELTSEQSHILQQKAIRTGSLEYMRQMQNADLAIDHPLRGARQTDEQITRDLFEERGIPWGDKPFEEDDGNSAEHDPLDDLELPDDSTSER